MMTKDEIKKGLEFCKADWCAMCPYCNCIGCAGFLKQDALALITEQEKEIERLKAENARLTAKLGQVLLSIDTVKEMNAMCNIEEQRKRAVQDFVVKLKEKCNGIWKYECSFENIIPFIQELLKEYE